MPSLVMMVSMTMTMTKTTFVHRPVHRKSTRTHLDLDPRRERLGGLRKTIFPGSRSDLWLVADSWSVQDGTPIVKLAARRFFGERGKAPAWPVVPCQQRSRMLVPHNQVSYSQSNHSTGYHTPHPQHDGYQYPCSRVHRGMLLRLQ